MPTESNKHPDPLVKEFCTLTKMSSPGNIHVVSSGEFRAKNRRWRPRKSLKGVKIKVSTPSSSSASAGSMLKHLRSSNMAGKARVRAESSPIDNRGGKRAIKSLVNDEIVKVLDDLKSADVNVDCNINDGSFIKLPLDKCLAGNQSRPVAKSSGLRSSPVHTNMGDAGNVSCEQTGSLDGITRAKTGMDDGMAGPSIGSEHTSMEDVVNTSYVPSSGLDGIASSKEGCSFEFGGMNDRKWMNGKVNGVGSTMLSNQFTVDVDRFAKKLKQGSEDEIFS
ncbi:hypothetical protein Tco_1186056 [Tanacetum coccineum]